MCEFFSCISDGKGKVTHFNLADIVEIMASGNPKNYSWNSHTSICHFNKLTPQQEDKVNKWEYNPYKKTLEADNGHPAGDDSKKVQVYLDKFFIGKNIDYLQNLYCSNTGHWNTGYRNTGYRNTGDRNIGNWNTGDSNTGNSNTGNRNTGNSNTGHWNTGDWNTGNWNTGNRNTGDRNIGDWNTGDMNATNGSNGVFCNKEPKILIFNRKSDMTLSDWRKSKYQILFNNFSLTLWIAESDMTDQEKIDHPKFYVAQGYLKKFKYKEACKNWWERLSDKEKKEVQTIPNFNKKIFLEITGIKI